MDKKLLNDIVNNINNVEQENKIHKRISRVHKYWARKPGKAISNQIKKYSKENDMVYDPFMGSGSIGFQTILLNRNYIGNDINPIAILVAEETLNNNFDLNIFKKEINDLKLEIFEEIQKLYSTKYDCPECNNKLVYKYLNVGPKFQKKEGILYCYKCNYSYRGKKKVVEIQDYKYKNPDIILDNWIPDTEFPKKFYKDRFSYKGVSKVIDLYSTRNLKALSLILNRIKSKKYIHENLFLLAFTNTLLHVSCLKSEGTRPLGVNNYWIPDDYIEENVAFRYFDRLDQVLKAKESQKILTKDKQLGKYNVFYKSALNRPIKEVFDYCITDPPYGDAIQYSELSYVWNAWLNESYDISEEIIINPEQDKDEDDFNTMLSNSIENIFWSLKKDKYFTLCFQNKDFSIWKNIVDKCKSLGFTLVDVSIYDTLGNSFNKNWAKFSPKSDIYVTFKKGKYEHNYNFDYELDLESLVNFLMLELDNDIISYDNKLYDVTVSYLIWYMFYGKINIDTFNLKDLMEIFNRFIGEGIYENKI